MHDVRIGGQPFDPRKTYTLAITDYQFVGGDGYSMFPRQHVIIEPESGPLVATALEKYISARGSVSPSIEGQITINP